jgi:hypothetical protein
MSTKFFLNFYGYKVTVDCDWEELSLRLKKDFSFFLADSEEVSDFSLKVENSNPSPEFDSSAYTYRSPKVSFFEEKGTRYCNYGDKVHSEIDFAKNRAKVCGKLLHPAHEVSYLMILSRVGKALDLKGLHRIHGGCWQSSETIYITLFSSGTGKSTLLSKLMEETGVSFYSDDSPLIDEKGKVLPFPLRVGFSKNDEVIENLKETPSYELERFRFGVKRLYSLEDLNWPIGGEYKKVVLISGKKSDRAGFKKTLGLSHGKQLVLEGLIGFGLPILYEYFWEYGFKDFKRKTMIFLKRSVALVRLWKNAIKYEVTLSSDPQESLEMIKKLMKEN